MNHSSHRALKRIGEGFLLSALLLATHERATAASFDCAKAQSKMEKAVCATPALSTLDERLAAAYKSARGSLSPDAAQALGAGQSSWLKFTSASCFVDSEAKPAAEADAVSCLTDAYEGRIAQLGETGKVIDGYKSYVVVDNAFKAFPDNVGSIKRSYVQLDDPSPVAATLNKLLKPGGGSKAAITDDDAGTSAVVSVSLEGVSPDLLQISEVSEVDLGGVHPEDGIRYRYFSKSLNRELTLGDIFASDDWKGPAKQLSQQALQKQQLEPISDVATAFDGKRLSDVFSYRVNGKNGFVLEREFLSYAERAEDIVELPWSSFSNVLTPYAKQQIPQLRDAQG